MPKDHLKHLLFIKSMVDELSAQQRIDLYRWLASVADDPWTTKQLLKLAADLEEVEKKSEEFNQQSLLQRDGD